MKWDQWIGKSDDGPIVMWIKHLIYLKRWGIRVDLHKIIEADDPGCFHSHPALAIRWVLWKGYDEEVLRWWRYTDDQGVAWQSTSVPWKPGRIGIVRPELIHRISRLYGKASYSVWIRFRVTHDIKLIGWGWPPEKRSYTSPVGDEQ